MAGLIEVFAVAGYCLPNNFGRVGLMDLERFGRIVYDRRNELGLTQEEVEENGGPTDTTMGKIENVEWTPGNRKVTLRKLDVGLKWEPGSAKRALDGGDPTPIGTQPAGDETDAIPPTHQLWTTVGDLSSRLGASLRAQAALFRWTQERLSAAEHAEHERMAGAAANPLMSASMDYLQQGMAASAARDPLAAAGPDFTRLSETAKRIKQESEQADVVDDAPPAGAPGQAGQTQEASLDEGEAAAASVTSRIKAMKNDGGLHNPDDPRKQRG